VAGKKAFRILETKPLDQDVYTLACERIERVFDTFDHVIISFSGGKDSTAVLQVALEVARSHPRFARHLPLRVVHYDEECIPQETADYVQRVAQNPDVALEWYCLPVKHRNACSRLSPWWWPWAPEDQEKWARPLPDGALTTLPGFPLWPVEARLSIPDTNGLLAPPRRGNVALLMGIRAQESLMRKRILRMSAPREHNWLVKSDDGTSQGNLWKAYPIYDWLTEDVWTAPAKFGWDYNRAYDLLEMAGVGHSDQRCSPAFGEEPIRGLQIYAQCFPDVWGRMVERVPGVGAAVRYSRTELYGYHGIPAKPDGMTWPEFVLHYAAQHGEASPQVVDSIRREIFMHYRTTSHPILVNTFHPETGLSWRHLIRLAMRGDFKGRNRASTNRPSNIKPEYARTWRKYVEELTELIETGRFPELAHPGTMPADPAALPPAYLREVVVGGGTSEAAARPESGAEGGGGVELDPAGVGGPVP
jgi:predicted phosphoadenosine phosphosulfate sulfurtransferase